MSEAYASTLDISFDIRGGLLMRQIHHWAALIFIVAIIVHMFRVFFTGAFRKPREINWVIGTILSLLALLEGFAGYSLPDDLLSGTGLRIADGFIQSIPVIGSYMSFFVFGGAFPGEAIIPRLYSVHMLLLPAIIVGAVHRAHRAGLRAQAHAVPRAGPDQQQRRRLPAHAGLHRQGRRLLLHRLRRHRADRRRCVTINPIWAYGPYDPSPITAGSQPDWYMGFADGALRLLPGWLEFVMFGFTWSMNIFLGAVAADPGDLHAASAPTRSSRPGSPATSASTTCSTGRATPRPAPASASWRSRSTWCSSSRPATTSSRSSCTCRSTTSPTCCGSACFVVPAAGLLGHQADLPRACSARDREKVLHGRETGTIVPHRRRPVLRDARAARRRTSAGRWCSTRSRSRSQLAAADRRQRRRTARSPARSGVRAKLSHFYFEDRVEPGHPGRAGCRPPPRRARGHPLARDLPAPRGAAGDPGPRPADVGARVGQARTGEGPLSP